jgi:hypothetical protein
MNSNYATLYHGVQTHDCSKDVVKISIVIVVVLLFFVFLFSGIILIVLYMLNNGIFYIVKGRCGY